MNQYYEFKDLQQYELVETHITDYWRTVTYKVPKSEEYSDKSVETVLKKFDIEFLPSGKHRMLHVFLKVRGINHGTDEKEDWDYDIKTFECNYSDAVLKCCLDDYLRFGHNNETTNERKSKYAMGDFSVGEIETMLEDYAKRNGIIRLNDDYPHRIWLVCYEHCRGDKEESKKTLITFCIKGIEKKRYVHDIYITNTYAEMLDKFKDSIGEMPEDDEFYNSYGKRNLVLHEFCTNSSKELCDKIFCDFNMSELLFDVSLIPMFLDTIRSTLRNNSKYDVIIRRYREKLMYAYEKCSEAKQGSKEHEEAKKQFTRTTFDLLTDEVFLEGVKEQEKVKVKEEDRLNGIEIYKKIGELRTMLMACCTTCGIHESLEECMENPYNKDKDPWRTCYKYMMRVLSMPEFLTMEPYRIQYLLDVFLHNTKNITPERMRLKLLCKYDIPNQHSITIETGEEPQTVILVPGKRLRKRDRTKEYQPIFSMMHRFSEDGKMRITIPEQIRFVSGKYNICIGNVCRGKKVKFVENSYMLRELSLATPPLYKTRKKLKPVPAPRINGPYVTLSDVCKRLEKLVYDM